MCDVTVGLHTDVRRRTRGRGGRASFHFAQLAAENRRNGEKRKYLSNTPKDLPIFHILMLARTVHNDNVN